MVEVGVVGFYDEVLRDELRECKEIRRDEEPCNFINELELRARPIFVRNYQIEEQLQDHEYKR
jgi:hypothetical protein